jgi:N-methylhydantoinase A
MSTIVSVDVGGTFTDVSVLAGAGLAMTKVRTTRDPVDSVLEAVADGLAAAGVGASSVRRVLHATTVATNAIFERTGARVAYVATEGFGDVVHIGREVRSGAERFQLTLPKPYPFVDEESVFEVPERVLADGRVLRPLDDDAVALLAGRLRAGGFDTVAVSLLHSYRNATHERRVREILTDANPDVEVMLSSEICPEPGEYERAMTTIVCAYLAPLVGRYLDRLADGLAARGVKPPVVVIGSDGAGVDASELRRRPIASLESGPVAGVMAAKGLIEELGLSACVTLDIGGTTSKAGVVVDGRIELTKDFRVGGPLSAASRRSATAIPVRMPVIDMAELGVGGGSIAWTDAAGLLRVGPSSAGAEPGPACFGTDGTDATVTDAAVACGLISGRPILGTNIPLRLDLALAALEKVGRPIGLDPMATAVAVRDVASAEIAAAVQRQLFYRGIDPSRLCLLAFGGTGPMHGAEVADIVGTPTVVVPRAAGVFTTFGLLSSEIGMERLEHARIYLTVDGDRVEATLRRLELEARQLLAANAAGPARVRIERSADVRFRNQVQTMALNLPEGTAPDAHVAAMFRQEYERQFGLTSGDDVEVVQLRVRAIAADASISRPRGQWSLRRLGTKPVSLERPAPAPIEHLELVAGPGPGEVRGPAVVDYPHTTVTVPDGWDGRLVGDGEMWLERRQETRP